MKFKIIPYILLLEAWLLANASTESFFFFKDFIYLLLEREEGREKEKEKNINTWEKQWSAVCLSLTPN